MFLVHGRTDDPAAMNSPRPLPNILITGTPGTGKSTMAQQLQATAPAMRHIEVGALVKDKQMHNGWDAELDTYEMDEERVRSPACPCPLHRRQSALCSAGAR